MFFLCAPYRSKKNNNFFGLFDVSKWKSAEIRKKQNGQSWDKGWSEYGQTKRYLDKPNTGISGASLLFGLFVPTLDKVPTKSSFLDTPNKNMLIMPRKRPQYLEIPNIFSNFVTAKTKSQNDTMFDELCSIYADALDNVGRYVDRETGECIQQMTIRDFCLSDRWRHHVEHLRALRQQYGDKAKKMDEYVSTKKQLPGATLSGLFAIWPDECTRRDGSKFMAPVSRRETHLQQHTGWLAIDIDLADNVHLANFDNVRMVCRFRPEIALLMRSCSGTGYFGLVRLAYPDRHKEQFKALIREYAALGITLDKQCGNIGRVRFASWDDPEHIYINERACEYRGVEAPTVLPMGSALPEWHGAGYPTADRPGSQTSGRTFRDDTPREIYLKAQRLVSKIEAKGVNILEDYDAWVRCGMALYHVSSTDGYGMWQRVSRFRPADAGHGHKEADFRQRWASFANYNVNAGTFFKMCKDQGVTLTKEDLREIYRQQ